MRRISSSTTFFYKRIFPVLFFAILATVIVVALKDATAGVPWSPVILVVALAAAGTLFMRKLLFDLLDQVFDDGAALVLKKGDRQERVALGDIESVHYSRFVNPPRIVLTLRRSTIFGDRVAFLPPLEAMPILGSDVARDLTVRTERARRGSVSRASA